MLDSNKHLNGSIDIADLRHRDFKLSGKLKEKFPGDCLTTSLVDSCVPFCSTLIRFDVVDLVVVIHYAYHMLF